MIACRFRRVQLRAQVSENEQQQQEEQCRLLYIIFLRSICSHLGHEFSTLPCKWQTGLLSLSHRFAQWQSCEGFSCQWKIQINNRSVITRMHRGGQTCPKSSPEAGWPLPVNHESGRPLGSDVRWEGRGGAAQGFQNEGNKRIAIRP